MRVLVLVRGALVAWLLVTAAPARADEAEGKLLRQGTYHGSELTAAHGDAWIGITITPTLTMVEPTRLKIEAAHDPIIDDENVNSGRKVSAEQGNPAYLIRDVTGVRAATVKTLFSTEPSHPKEMSAGESIPLDLGAAWSLQAEAMATKLMEGSTPPLRLMARSGGTRKLIVELPQGINAERARGVIWAGDLNQDGRPDFIIDISTHYNVLKPALFLSRTSKGGWGYKLVAYCETTGC